MPSLDEALSAADDALDIDLSGAVEYIDAPIGGPYVAEIRKTTRKPSRAGDPYMQFYADVAEGEFKGARLPITWASLTGNTGTLKTWLRAMGFNVDTDRIKVSPSAIVGKRLVVRVEQDGDYTRAVVVGPVAAKSAFADEFGEEPF